MDSEPKVIKDGPGLKIKLGYLEAWVLEPLIGNHLREQNLEDPLQL